MENRGAGHAARVKRSVVTSGVAILGGLLWLLWNAEHALTGVRAPWTGLTLMAGGAAFVVVGCIGPSLRAVIASACAGGLAMLGVDPLIWRSERWLPGSFEPCDPGCVDPVYAVVIVGVVAAILAALGVAIRLTGPGPDIDTEIKEETAQLQTA